MLWDDEVDMVWMNVRMLECAAKIVASAPNKQGPRRILNKER